MYMSVLPTCIFVYYMHAWCPWRLAEGVRFLGTEVTDNCEVGCMFWEANSGPLEEQPLLLAAESSSSPSRLSLASQLVPCHFLSAPCCLCYFVPIISARTPLWNSLASSAL